MLPNHLRQNRTRVVEIFTSHPDKSGLNVNYMNKVFMGLIDTLFASLFIFFHIIF